MSLYRVFLLCLSVSIFLSSHAIANGCDAECRQLKSLLEREAGRNPVNKVWIKMRELQNQCDAYPYFPDSGINSAYCFFKSMLPQSRLEKMSGHKVFLSSPHRNDNINNGSARAFGRYNPRFLRWAIDHFLPNIADQRALAVTQKNYQWGIATTAKHYYLAYLQLRIKNQENQKIRHDYRSAINQGKYYDYEYLYDYFKLEFEEPIAFANDGNIMKTAVLFWIRREIDGTAAVFVEALEKLFARYEPQFLQRSKKIRRTSLFY